MGVAFVIANPMIFSPKVWNYLNAYSGERLLTHTGYLMGDSLYKNNTFHARRSGPRRLLLSFFLAIKVPWPCWRHRSSVHREPPSLAQAQLWFCLVHDPVWIVPYS